MVAMKAMISNEKITEDLRLNSTEKIGLALAQMAVDSADFLIKELKAEPKKKKVKRDNPKKA
jgi:hypothetical protein